MAFNFNFSFGTAPKQPESVEVDNQGNWFYTLFSSKGNAKKYTSTQKKLDVILSNPACLKVFALNCDLFSLGKVNSEKEIDYLETLRRRPNYKQTWTQFYWDYMFWLMTGTAYLWKSGGRILNDGNTLQWLNPAKLDFKPSTVTKMTDFILTKASWNDLKRETVKYSLGNGKVKYIPLDEITPFHDLSSGMNENFYVGASRIDALYKIISNSEQALDSKSINLEFSRKFVVSGMSDPNNITQLPMGEDEKNDVRHKLRGAESLTVTKSQISISHFVDNMAALKLDDSYTADYYNIGSMFNIPKDVLEIYNSKGATYENQEKSRVAHIDYVMSPKGAELCDALEELLEIEFITMSWGHLACYQVFEKEKQGVIQLKINNAILAKENGLDINKL